MLVILHGLPVTAPLETMLDEEAIAEVALRNLIGEVLAAVDIGLTRSRLDEQRTVLLTTHTGVIKRIDIDGESTGMVREFRAALHYPITVARRVVGTHRCLVVIAILGDWTDTLNRIFRLIKLREDLCQVLRYLLVAYDDALMRHTLTVDMTDLDGVKYHTSGL